MTTVKVEKARDSRSKAGCLAVTGGKDLKLWNEWRVKSQVMAFGLHTSRFEIGLVSERELLRLRPHHGTWSSRWGGGLPLRGHVGGQAKPGRGRHGCGSHRNLRYH